MEAGTSRRHSRKQKQKVNEDEISTDDLSAVED